MPGPAEIGGGRGAAPVQTPWLPAGATMTLAGRGEMFFRHHRHTDSTRPTVLLLHGWTASADTQFYSAYEALAADYSFVAPDHRGHGRGLRRPFTLEDVADDVADLVRHLRLGPLVVVGYSMGGPITLLLAHRHPELVSGVVVQATAMEWRSSRWERVRWKAARLLGPGLRSMWYPRALRLSLRRLAHDAPGVAPLVPWLEGEIRRNDPVGVVEAAMALSRYDARGFAGSLGVPASSLVTTKDRLVPPRKQRALAAALGAEVVELADDHLCTIVDPVGYSAAMMATVRSVSSRVEGGPSARSVH